MNDDAASSSAAVPEAINKHKVVVLLIDAQRIIGEAVKRALEFEKDIAYHYCQNPRMAMQFAVEASPTVILQDIFMPDGDGFALVREFKRDPRTKDIPLIVLTSEADAKVKSKAFSLGANDYLMKLPDRTELVARVRHHSQGYINMLERNEAFETMIKTEKALALNHRLEAIGQLAAGIAHEINTPIQYIGDNLLFLQNAFQSFCSYQKRLSDLHAAQPQPSDMPERMRQFAAELDADYFLEEIPKALKQSVEGIEKVAKLVQAMKEFSHPEEKEKVAVDINKALASAIAVATNEWKYVADLTTDFAANLPLTLCHPSEMSQVYLNIIVNAAQAIAESQGKSGAKGHISVQTRLNGNMVEIRIKDSGPGIPDSIKDKIFTQFFTTKEVGKGTGQGLSIARSIVVRKHGGQLCFESEEGKGATFIIKLPFNAPQANAEETLE